MPKNKRPEIGEEPSVKMPKKLHLPNDRQSALLLLKVVDKRDERREGRRLKPLTRAKLTGSMLKELWGRQRLPSDFLQAVADWLLIAGWTFFAAGPVYAIVRVAAVQNWPRLSTTEISEELESVKSGSYDFDDIERLFLQRREPEEASDLNDEDLG